MWQIVRRFWGCLRFFDESSNFCSKEGIPVKKTVNESSLKVVFPLVSFSKGHRTVFENFLISDSSCLENC